jgi:hypothetical protein
MNIFNTSQRLEFAQAEVLAVDYSGYYKQNGYYTISCRLLNSKTDNDKIFATPLDYNVKKLPIVGEIVVLVVAASQYSKSTNVGKSFYYLNTVPVHKSYNHNALPTVTSKNSVYYKQQDSDASGFSSGRVIVKNTAEPKIDETFQEKEEIMPLQMFSGDVLIEGRYGNSIRFGSTLKPTHPFANAPAWSIGTSKIGDPITIISNGRKQNINNRLSVESINDDNSSIWLTSGQQIFFAPSSFTSNLQRNNKLDTGFKNNFSGNQIFINSDRVNLNAKKYEINISSRGGISLSSDRIITIESNPKIELEASKINLGINATHPALLGDVTFDLLTQLCDNLMNLCEELSREIHLTGVGPTDPPKNAAQYTSIRSNIDKIKQELPKIKSNLVFLNKSALASDEADKESKEQFKENLRS